MLAVLLTKVKTFHICRVATYIFNKKVLIIFNVPVIKTESHSSVYLPQSLFALFNQWHYANWFWFYSCLKSGKSFWIGTLCHTVMNQFEERLKVEGNPPMPPFRKGG